MALLKDKSPNSSSTAYMRKVPIESCMKSRVDSNSAARSSTMVNLDTHALSAPLKSPQHETRNESSHSSLSCDDSLVSIDTFTDAPRQKSRRSKSTASPDATRAHRRALKTNRPSKDVDIAPKSNEDGDSSTSATLKPGWIMDSPPTSLKPLMRRRCVSLNSESCTEEPRLENPAPSNKSCSPPSISNRWETSDPSPLAAASKERKHINRMGLCTSRNIGLKGLLQSAQSPPPPPPPPPSHYDSDEDDDEIARTSEPTKPFKEDHHIIGSPRLPKRGAFIDLESTQRSHSMSPSIIRKKRIEKRDFRQGSRGVTNSSCPSASLLKKPPPSPILKQRQKMPTRAEYEKHGVIQYMRPDGSEFNIPKYGGKQKVPKGPSQSLSQRVFLDAMSIVDGAASETSHDTPTTANRKKVRFSATTTTRFICRRRSISSIERWGDPLTPPKKISKSVNLIAERFASGMQPDDRPSIPRRSNSMSSLVSSGSVEILEGIKSPKGIPIPERPPLKRRSSIGSDMERRCEFPLEPPRKLSTQLEFLLAHCTLATEENSTTPIPSKEITDQERIHQHEAPRPQNKETTLSIKGSKALAKCETDEGSVISHVNRHETAMPGRWTKIVLPQQSSSRSLLSQTISNHHQSPPRRSSFRSQSSNGLPTSTFLQSSPRSQRSQRFVSKDVVESHFPSTRLQWMRVSSTRNSEKGLLRSDDVMPRPTDRPKRIKRINSTKQNDEITKDHDKREPAHGRTMNWK